MLQVAYSRFEIMSKLDNLINLNIANIALWIICFTYLKYQTFYKKIIVLSSEVYLGVMDHKHV